MRRTITLFLAFVLCGPGLAVAETKPAKQLLKATDVVNEIMGAPDKGIVLPERKRALFCRH